MDIITRGFEDGAGENNITYVVGKYSKLHKRFYWNREFEDIEDAKDYMSVLQKLNPNVRYGIFERIKAETINELVV